MRCGLLRQKDVGSASNRAGHGVKDFFLLRPEGHRQRGGPLHPPSPVSRVRNLRAFGVSGASPEPEGQLDEALLWRRGSRYSQTPL